MLIQMRGTLAMAMAKSEQPKVSVQLNATTLLDPQ